jgi:hypothetical protein
MQYKNLITYFFLATIAKKNCSKLTTFVGAVTYSGGFFVRFFKGTFS